MGMVINELSLGQSAWSFETDLLNIMILSIRETINERKKSVSAWAPLMALKSISKNVNSKIDEKYESDKLDLAKRITDRWMIMKTMNMDKDRRPTINFGKYPVGTKCQWPGDCLAESPTDDEKAFVKAFHEIVILRDIFCIQGDHLLANRWGGKEMIPLCGLHNRQKQDAMWPTILIDAEVI